MKVSIVEIGIFAYVGGYNYANQIIRKAEQKITWCFWIGGENSWKYPGVQETQLIQHLIK